MCHTIGPIDFWEPSGVSERRDVQRWKHLGALAFNSGFKACDGSIATKATWENKSRIQQAVQKQGDIDERSRSHERGEHGDAAPKACKSSICLSIRTINPPRLSTRRGTIFVVLAGYLQYGLGVRKGSLKLRRIAFRRRRIAERDLEARGLVHSHLESIGAAVRAQRLFQELLDFLEHGESVLRRRCGVARGWRRGRPQR